jgi:hypothetical protein
MRTVQRPRRYMAAHWITLLSPMFVYNEARHAYVLRGVGRHFGPVLRMERRVNAGQLPNGVDRRRRATTRSVVA